MSFAKTLGGSSNRKGRESEIPPSFAHATLAQVSAPSY